MSVFYCNGCDRLRDSDEEGMHSFEDGNLCDECESCSHSEDFNTSMNEFWNLLSKDARNLILR